jgi:dTDP-4-dehydrorhamnose reductase
VPAGRPGRRLLVTGGSGQLGSEVVATASAAGWDVVATTHRSPGRRIDLADTASVERLVHELRPRAVVHTAYAKDVPQMYAVIVDGSAALARACAAVDARLVHVSSDAVFSGTAGRPYVEADRPDPVNAYGGAKAAAEERVLRAARRRGGRTHLPAAGRTGAARPHERAAADRRDVLVRRGALSRRRQ